MVPSLTTDPPAAQRRHWRAPVTLPDYRLGKEPPNKGRKFPAEVLTPREVEQLLAACSRRSTGGRRDAALIVVLWRGALRIREALDLFPKDVDLAAGVIRVLHGKRDRERTVGIDPQACAVIERWIERRASLGISSRARLFCTFAQPTPGRPLWHSQVRERFKDLAVKAGVEKRVHPHGFRHTAAYDMRLEGLDLRVIQQQLGHRRLDTTALYIDHLAPVERIRLLRERTWGRPAAAAPAADPLAELELLHAQLERLEAQVRGH